MRKLVAPVQILAGNVKTPTDIDCDTLFFVLSPGQERESLVKLRALAVQVGNVLDAPIGTSVVKLDHIDVLKHETMLELAGEEETEMVLDAPAPILLNVEADALDAMCQSSERIECCYLRVDREHFYWEFYPKHGNIQHETQLATFEMIGLKPKEINVAPVFKEKVDNVMSLGYAMDMVYHAAVRSEDLDDQLKAALAVVEDFITNCLGDE